jgi:orotidine-5'-phosphate decarboxylase
MTFGERFQARCAQARVPICVGLDPRLDRIPALVREWALARSSSRDEAVRRAIARFHELAIAAVADLVPAVKLQLAFYEQYGIAGLLALRDTIEAARRAELLVIADGKRNDIPSTAEAYARAYLGRTDMFGEPSPAFEADALTVNPYLGWDSLVPFAEAARVHGTGAFILAHTSNPSAIDLQEIHDGASPIYLRVAELIARLGNEFFPEGRFSSVGAIVGCTYPGAAAAIRRSIPRSPIVVVGFGAQAGALVGCLACFTEQGDGALVNASRSLTYDRTADPTSEDDLMATIRRATESLGKELTAALSERASSAPASGLACPPMSLASLPV